VHFISLQCSEKLHFHASRHMTQFWSYDQTISAQLTSRLHFCKTWEGNATMSV